MKTIEIIVIAYIVLSSTLGAYYLTVIDPRCKGYDITLFDILGHSFIAVFLIVPLLIIDLFSKIVIKKHK
jgi:hypothetical protein